MPDEPMLLLGRQQCHVVQREPHRDPVDGGQHRPRLVSRAAPPHTRAVQMPRPVQPEMGVQAAPVVEPREQVLADAHHVEHPTPGQVVPHPARMPQLPAHQHPTGQRRVQPLAGEVDGVALGHAAHRSPAVSPGDVVPPPIG